MTKHDFICEACKVGFVLESPVGEPPPQRVECSVKCGGYAYKHWGADTALFLTKGPGWSTRTGRNKKCLEKKNAKLGKTQWDNHEVVAPVGKPRNPTPGGPLDPNRK